MATTQVTTTPLMHVISILSNIHMVDSNGRRLKVRDRTASPRRNTSLTPNYLLVVVLSSVNRRELIPRYSSIQHQPVPCVLLSIFHPITFAHAHGRRRLEGPQVQLYTPQPA